MRPNPEEPMRANSAEYHRGYQDCMKEWLAAEWKYGVGYSPNPKIHKKLVEIVKAASNPHDTWD